MGIFLLGYSRKHLGPSAYPWVSQKSPIPPSRDSWTFPTPPHSHSQGVPGHLQIPHSHFQVFWIPPKPLFQFPVLLDIPKTPIPLPAILGHFQISHSQF